MGDNGKRANYTKPTGFRLSDIVKEKLAKMAISEGMEMAEIVRGLINKEYSVVKDEVEYYFKTNPDAHEKLNKIMKK